jgi:hypothetical protein
MVAKVVCEDSGHSRGVLQGNDENAVRMVHMAEDIAQQAAASEGCASVQLGALSLALHTRHLLGHSQGAAAASQRLTPLIESTATTASSGGGAGSSQTEMSYVQDPANHVAALLAQSVWHCGASGGDQHLAAAGFARAAEVAEQHLVRQTPTRFAPGAEPQRCSRKPMVLVLGLRVVFLRAV